MSQFVTTESGQVVEFTTSQYEHPDVRARQKTNGPAQVFVRVPGGEWIATGLHHAHKVRADLGRWIPGEVRT